LKNQAFEDGGFYIFSHREILFCIMYTN